ncbi:MAG: tRNA lysidine(34) synthetase TilS [Bacteroidota bacterium]
MSNNQPADKAPTKQPYSRKNHRREKIQKTAAVEVPSAAPEKVVKEVVKTAPIKAPKPAPAQGTKAAPIAKAAPPKSTEAKPVKAKLPLKAKPTKAALLKEAVFKNDYLKDNPLKANSAENLPKESLLKDIPQKAPLQKDQPRKPLFKEKFLKEIASKENLLKEKSSQEIPQEIKTPREIPVNDSPLPNNSPRENQRPFPNDGFKKDFRRDGGRNNNPRFQKQDRRPQHQDRAPQPEPNVSPLTEEKLVQPQPEQQKPEQPRTEHSRPQQFNKPPQQQKPAPEKPQPKTLEKRRPHFIPTEPPPSQTETDPFLKDFYRKLENSLKELDVEKGSSIICAVSGGVDSVAMFHALLALAPSHGFRISVAHCNHNLRGQDSHRDEQFVRHITKKNNLYFNHTQVNVKHFAAKNSFSLEKAARVMRYRFFEKVARDSKFQYLSTAHTADDAAETFFLNLLRGSGLTGLSGIPARRPLTNKTSVIRPVLHFTKAELIEYAKKRNLEWHEDVTNSLSMFTRNKVRNELLPLLKEKFSPAVNDVIIRTMHLLQGADKVVTTRVNELVPHVAETTNGQTLLKTSLFSGLDEFIQGEIIQKIISEKFDSSPVSYEIIDRIIALLSSETGAICEISKQVYALRDRDGILFIKKTPVFNLNVMLDKIGSYEFGDHKIVLKEIPNRDLEFGADLNIEYFDADLLPKRLSLRTWQPGDAFQPIGMLGTMKVSDFLTNEKVPLLDKLNVLVLATSSDIIWVCGMRISDKFKVTEKTDKVISVEFIPPKNA